MWGEWYILYTKSHTLRDSATANDLFIEEERDYIYIYQYTVLSPITWRHFDQSRYEFQRWGVINQSKYVCVGVLFLINSTSDFKI